MAKKKIVIINPLICIQQITIRKSSKYLKIVVEKYDFNYIYSTRNKINFSLDHIYKNKAENSILFRGVIKYNKLDV